MQSPFATVLTEISRSSKLGNSFRSLIVVSLFVFISSFLSAGMPKRSLADAISFSERRSSSKHGMVFKPTQLVSLFFLRSRMTSFGWPLKSLAEAIKFSDKLSFISCGCFSIGRSVILLIERSHHYSYTFELTWRYLRASGFSDMNERDLRAFVLAVSVKR